MKQSYGGKMTKTVDAVKKDKSGVVGKSLKERFLELFGEDSDGDTYTPIDRNKKSKLSIPAKKNIFKKKLEQGGDAKKEQPKVYVKEVATEKPKKSIHKCCGKG
jgi:hypothetical protein